jgi:hypothetical protein
VEFCAGGSQWLGRNTLPTETEPFGLNLQFATNGPLPLSARLSIFAPSLSAFRRSEKLDFPFSLEFCIMTAKKLPETISSHSCLLQKSQPAI